MWPWSRLLLHLAASRARSQRGDLSRRSGFVFATLATVDASVPPVLDSVVTAIRHIASDLGPFPPEILDHILDEVTFFAGDGVVVQIGLEILIPSLSALLGGSVADHL